ncbi:MAG: TraR/DksA family transcriptional regulator [Thermoleophilia bacterium]
MDSALVRRKLLEERERVLREIDSLEENLSDPSSEASEENHHRSHMAESAAFTLDRQMELTLDENARHVLGRIDRALEKLESGTYGMCDSCGKKIDAGRLKAAPYAGLCIDCQRLEDRGL